MSKQSSCGYHLHNGARPRSRRRIYGLSKPPCLRTLLRGKDSANSMETRLEKTGRLCACTSLTPRTCFEVWRPRYGHHHSARTRECRFGRVYLALSIEKCVCDAAQHALEADGASRLRNWILCQRAAA